MPLTFVMKLCMLGHRHPVGKNFPLCWEPLDLRCIFGRALGYETCLKEELAPEEQLGVGTGRAVMGVAPGRLDLKVKSEPGPPMTLGGAAAAQLRFIVWCKDCQHQVEPDPGGDG
jgi:hypothetical protein